MSKNSELRDLFKKHNKDGKEHAKLLQEYFYSNIGDWNKFLEVKERSNLVRREKEREKERIRREMVWSFKPNKKGIQAEGFLVNDGFMIKEGSVAAPYKYDSKDKGVKKYGVLRKELEDNRVIVNNVFCKQYVFASPMAAAVVVFGGWCTQNSWINKDGLCLGDYLGKK